MEHLWWRGDEQKLTFVNDKIVDGCDDSSTLRQNEVLVEVAFSGVCGSDFAYMRGAMGKHNCKQNGVVLGHEFSGVVLRTGSQVHDIKAGDKVAVDPNSSCDLSDCINDDDKNPHYCERNDAIGVKKNGGWSQRCIVPRKQVYKIPASLPLDVAALCEPFSCVLRGWRHLNISDTGGRVLVQGAGIIGVLFTLLLRHSGYDDVTVAEISEERRNKVEAFLPENYKVLDPKEIREKVCDDSDVKGFHMIIDCTGNLMVFQQNIEMACRGAQILAFGCCPSTKKVEIEPFQIYWKELKLMGSFLNPKCFDESIRLLDEINSKGWIELAKMGVEKHKLFNHEKALTRLRSGQASKIFFEI